MDLSGRRSSHVVLFLGVLLSGVAVAFLFAEWTNAFAWIALIWGTFAVFVGLRTVEAT